MKIKKVVTFRASSIGDCLMAKYLLENIHLEFPEAKCAIVVAGRAKMIRDLLSSYQWIEVIEANRRNLRAVLSLWWKYHGSDLVVTQYAGKPGGRFGLTSKFMARILAHKGGYVGFDDPSRWNKILFDHTIPVRSDRAVVWHEQEALRTFDIPKSISFPKIIFQKDTNILENFGLRPGNFIVLHLFAGGLGRGMNPEKKRELIDYLVGMDRNLQIVISGGIGDREELLRITRDLPVTIIAGKTTLQELMNVIFNSRGVISLDTGVAHISAQLGKPLVVLRTCLAPNWWFAEQYGPSAPINILSSDRSCSKGHIFKDYPGCLNDIPIDDIGKAIRQYII